MHLFNIHLIRGLIFRSITFVDGVEVTAIDGSHDYGWFNDDYFQSYDGSKFFTLDRSDRHLSSNGVHDLCLFAWTDRRIY